MRSRTTLYALLFAVGLFALPYAAHAAIPFFDPIIDKSWTVSETGIQCALGWGAVITVINNIIQFIITLVIVFVAPLMLAYSGFLYVVNPVDPSGIKKARDILKNTVLGLIIALAGWMIVDAVMVVLYNPDASSGATRLEAWSNLITSGNALTCLPQQGVGTGLNQGTNGAGVAVVPPTGNLVNITAFSCKNTASCQVSDATNTKLNQMKTGLGAAASQYQITETGVNTTVTHASGTGNLDMSCYGPCSAGQVKAAIAAWPGSVKYETASQADYNSMITAGVPATNILGPTWFTGTFSNGVCSTGTGHCITAPHMSLNS